MLLLFLDYSNSGDFSKEQLEEILQVLLLLWLFHEDYYGKIFRPVTDPELGGPVVTTTTVPGVAPTDLQAAAACR